MSVFLKAKQRFSTHLATKSKPKAPAQSPPPRHQAPQLPPEILEIILQEVRASSHAALITAMAVCRDWKAVGETLLWTHVVFNPERIPLFLMGLKPTYARQVHSLAISFVDHYSAFKGEDLDLLPRALECLPQLEVFSIRISNMRFDDPPSRHLQKIVQALPQSTKSLQIEHSMIFTKKADLSDNHEFTALLSLRLPQLRHLRIFGQLCCEHFFGNLFVASHSLESLVLNSFCYHSPIASCGHHIDVDDLVLNASTVVQRGLVPSLRIFTIVHQHSDKKYYYQQYQTAELLRDTMLPVAVQVKRILREETSMFPVTLNARNETSSVRLVKNGSPRDVWGTKFDIACALEGDDAWIQTTSGSQFPPSYRVTGEGEGANHVAERQRRRLNLQDRQYSYSFHGTVLPWYSVEEELGEPLLLPTTYNGLHSD